MVGGAIFIPVFRSSREVSPERKCLSQIKQLSTCMMIYIVDSDDLFPPKTWDAELKPYYKIDEILTCPEVKKQKKEWGYAMNLAVMGVDTVKIADPSKRVMFFETDALARDVVANLAARSLTRHGKGPDAGSVVTFCDTSAKFKKGTEKL